jgi:hypothetical protein
MPYLNQQLSFVNRAVLGLDYQTDLVEVVASLKQVVCVKG